MISVLAAVAPAGAVKNGFCWPAAPAPVPNTVALLSWPGPESAWVWLRLYTSEPVNESLSLNSLMTFIIALARYCEGMNELKTDRLQLPLSAALFATGVV